MGSLRPLADPCNKVPRSNKIKPGSLTPSGHRGHARGEAKEWAMEFGIFNLMGSREPEKPTAEVFAEVAEQTRLADELGYAIAWFAEHHFSNYCLCASPLMLVAHCASITKKIRLGTAVVVLPLYNPARLLAEIATADALSNGRLMLGVGAGYQPYEFERFGVGIAPVESATVTLHLADGTEQSEHIRHGRGTPGRPMSDAELDSKVQELAAHGAPFVDATGLIAAVRGIEGEADPTRLMRLTVPA